MVKVESHLKYGLVLLTSSSTNQTPHNRSHDRVFKSLNAHFGVHYPDNAHFSKTNSCFG